MSRPIFGLYILITCYSRIIQNSELEDLAQDHRYPRGFGSPYFFSQPYKLCVVVPSRLATSLTEYPLSVTCLTASFLNSSV